MLWQSSLLIVVVFALDCALARKIRPAVRHALWLVVLVKLLLPPALALPTGAAWWLWPAKPPLTPLIKSQVVTFDTAPLPDFTPQTIPLAPPPVRLSGTGWMVLAAGTVSAALLAWLVVNWLTVARKTRRAAASSTFDDTRQEAQHLAGLRGSLRLRLVDDTLSPAVYGLFRPVILLPRALAEKLSAAQLRAVLLHEAIHVRRGDVWVNCAQTLLQIAYWWHPLLWLANARIRRLREEAVDDAVMLALRADAAAYAPTLLEVAKFAVCRPLTSLGLVGILESRSKLRQRIERLVNFRPPRQAGVTALSLCGILAFSAVALPMGQAPVSTTDSVSTGSASPSASVPSWLPPGSSNVTATMALPPATALSSRTPVQIEGSFFQMSSRDVETLTAGLSYDPGQIGEAPYWRADAEEFKEINQRIKSLQARPFSRNRIETGSGTGAELYHGTRTNWITFDCDPIVSNGRIELDEKADACSVSPLGETNTIKLNGHATMENNGGMILSTQGPDDSSSNLVLVINAKMVQQKTVSADPPGAVGATNKFEMRTFKLGTNTFHVNLHKEIDFQTNIVINPTNVLDPQQNDENHYSRQWADDSLPRGKEPGEPGRLWRASTTVNPASLEMRTFKVNTNSFPAAVRKETGEPHVSLGLKEIFSKVGVNLDPPKTIFYNDGLGILFVSATHQDLDVIQRVVESMSRITPQIHIKARFFKVPRTFFDDAQNSLPAGLTNGDVLTAAQAREFLHQLESQEDSEELAEPEVTTLAGRQTQMRATVIQPIITNFLFVAGSPGHDFPTLSPQKAPLETGPILDVIPMTLPDGYTIDLITIASLIKFFGYADPQGLPPHYETNYDGRKIEVPAALPAFGIAEAKAQSTLYDGQTLVLLPKPEYEYNGYFGEEAGKRITQHIHEAEKKDGNRPLIVLVTATLIDAVGNRIHSDAEMSFAQTRVPPPWP